MVTRLKGDEFLQAHLAGAIATSNPYVHVAYRVMDGDRLVLANELTTQLNGTSDVTLLAAVSIVNQYIDVDEVRLVNTDTAAVTLILEKDDTSTETELAHPTVAVNERVTIR